MYPLWQELEPFNNRLAALLREARTTYLDYMVYIVERAFGPVTQTFSSADLREIGVDDTEPED